MERKTISFAPDTIITFEESKMTFRGQGVNNYINNENLDTVSYISVSQRRIGFIALWFRLSLYVALLGVVMIVVEGLLFDTAESVVAMLTTGLVVGGIAPLLLFLMVVDLMIGTNVTNSILDKYYSLNAFKVTIGNKSGNNIDFHVALDEESGLIALRECIERIKANTGVQSNTSSDLDGLRKLDSLLKDGILTREEFDLKKKQLLGL